MTMENNEMMGFGGYGFLIVLILFIWLIFGGGFGNMGGIANRGCYPVGGCAGVSGCEVERREIIDAARTQFLVEQTSRNTQEQAMAGLSALGTKIDYYEYQNGRDKQQDLREQLAQERAKNIALETRIYSDAKFGALEAQMQAMSCAMLKQPQVYGIAGACVPMYVPPFPTTTSTATTG